jgi:peptidyl-prolyl cis-trans isomerase A (cyclophilin A)
MEHKHDDLPGAKEYDEIATVSCGTTAGDIVLEFHRHWSPEGYDRAVSLFEKGFYDHSHFFRTVPNFLVQFGISYSTDAAIQKLAKTQIPDDPQLVPAVPFNVGTISYAGTFHGYSKALTLRAGMRSYASF